MPRKYFSYIIICQCFVILFTSLQDASLHMLKYFTQKIFSNKKDETIKKLNEANQDKFLTVYYR